MCSVVTNILSTKAIEQAKWCKKEMRKEEMAKVQVQLDKVYQPSASRRRQRRMPKFRRHDMYDACHHASCKERG